MKHNFAMHNRFKQVVSLLTITVLGVGLLVLFMAQLSRAAVAAPDDTLDVCATCTYTTIQTAVNAANPGDTIRVAQGTYQDVITATGLNTTTVLITKELTLVGGYSPDFQTHDPDVYETIVDGQNIAKGFYVFGASAHIEGFTIINGLNQGVLVRADFESNPGSAIISSNNIHDNPGTGIVFYQANGEASNNVLANNLWEGVGFLEATVAVISNTITHNNLGGIWAQNATTTISNNQIISNTAVNGGGITLDAGLFTITHNLVQDNFSDDGGGINIVNGATGLVAYNDIIGNISGGGGGGIRAYENGELTVMHNTVVANRSFYGGGGIDINAANMPAAQFTVTHNIISDNQAQTWSGGGIFVLDGATGLIAYNEIAANETADHGGGIGAYNNGPLTIDHNNILLNTAQYGGGGIHVNAEGNDAPQAIENNTLYTNTAEYGAGIHLVNTVGDVSIASNDIRTNHTTGPDYSAGGIYVDNVNGLVTVVNNVITQNDNRGVKGVNYTEINVINNTIVGNGASAIEMHGWPVTSTIPMTTTLINNIIADHPDCAFFGFYGAVFAVYNNDVVGHDLDDCGASIVTQSGNINADPLFANAANGNYRLAFASPAVDSGTTTNAPATDIEGTPRPQGSGIDMGAYEAIRYQIFLPGVAKPLPSGQATIWDGFTH